MLNNCKTLETFAVPKVSLTIFAPHMKDKIIHKASEMFITLGFKSVTMDDIANELAISKKTIYTHFKNKTELVHEVTMNMFELISHGIDCICDLQKNPIEELYEIKKLVMVHLKNEKTSPQYQLQKYYPEIHEALKAQHYQKMNGHSIMNRHSVAFLSYCIEFR